VSESGTVSKVKVAPELAAITYLISMPFTSFEEFSLTTKSPHEICSFVETKVDSLDVNQFIEFNKRNISRFYPKGSRTMSSNYNPDPVWCAGCQMAALNLQTMGKMAWINQGKFKDNAGCGYVLKPAWMRHNSRVLLAGGISPPSPISLSVEILSARQLPKSKRKKGELVNPFVKISVQGHADDAQAQTTHTIRSNGFNPFWGKKMQFTVKFPELAVLLILVYDDDTFASWNGRQKIAYYSLPIGCIKQGYRVLELYNEDGKKSMMSDLLCRFNISPIEDPPPPASV
jgi:phosphatidylinositol phospholipase C, delta